MHIPLLVHMAALHPACADPNELPAYPSDPAYGGKSRRYARSDHRHPFQLAADTPDFTQEVLRTLQRNGANVQGFTKPPQVSNTASFVTLAPAADSFTIIEGELFEDLTPQTIKATPYPNELYTWLFLDPSGLLVQSPLGLAAPLGWVPVARVEWNPNGTIKELLDFTLSLGLHNRERIVEPVVETAAREPEIVDYYSLRDTDFMFVEQDGLVNKVSLWTLKQLFTIGEVPAPPLGAVLDQYGWYAITDDGHYVYTEDQPYQIPVPSDIVRDSLNAAVFDDEGFGVIYFESEYVLPTPSDGLRDSQGVPIYTDNGEYVSIIP